MKWYRLGFGSPMADQQPVLDHDPEIIDQARRPGNQLGVAPSPYDASKPGDKLPPKKRRLKRRRPGPDLEMGLKRPTDGTGWPRPTGDLRA